MDKVTWGNLFLHGQTLTCIFIDALINLAPILLLIVVHYLWKKPLAKMCLIFDASVVLGFLKSTFIYTKQISFKTLFMAQNYVNTGLHVSTNWPNFLCYKWIHVPVINWSFTLRNVKVTCSEQRVFILLTYTSWSSSSFWTGPLFVL